LLLAFAGGQIIAWVYMMTHSGLSYSRSFVNALIIMPLITCLVMMVLSNNLITAFGMMAVFAIVRFRNILRDTLGHLVRCSLSSSWAWRRARRNLPVPSRHGALLAGVALSLVHLFRQPAPLRSDRQSPLVSISQGTAGLAPGARTRHSWKAHLASQRSHEGYEGTDLSYRLLLRNSERVDDLLNELRQ